MTPLPFEKARNDLRVIDSRQDRKGVVQSIAGSRTAGVMKARVIKVKWEDGTFEDFSDGFPKGIEMFDWI